MKTELLVKKATYLRIQAAELAEGIKSGNFHSLYRGQGIEFTGVRDYIRGDDVRSIDWNVTARMGKPFVKMFVEEREFQIFLIVDSSLSMRLDTKSCRRTKFESAEEAAALVTIAAELNGCPIGAVFFDGAIYFSCKPALSKENTMNILNNLYRTPKGATKGSSLGNAIECACNLLRMRSLVFVLSDFRSAEWETPMTAIAHKNDVIAINIHDFIDEELPSLGTVVFEDVESGIKMDLPSSSEKFKKEWRRYNQKKTERWQDFCYKHGILPVTMDTKSEPLQVLNSIFTRKARAR